MPFPNPKVTSLVACLGFEHDEVTGQCNLKGVFGAFVVDSFPVHFPQLHLYTALTNGRGTVQLDFRIVDAQDSPIFARNKKEIVFDDPLAYAFVELECTDVIFPRPGRYNAQVWCGDDLLMSLNLTALQISPTK